MQRGLVFAVELLHSYRRTAAIANQGSEQGTAQAVMFGVIVDFAEQHIAHARQSALQLGR
ncbi:MAG: hypothetical protein AUI19_04900 [Myxococcales bacterium 13_1_40CM_2_68_15]|nr:MAG: hypothetical protein AUI19_04900 [Myxococcales bacterium 13_1_40CM_2_68_15]